MKNILIKILLLLAVSASFAFGAPQENVIFSKHMDAKYDQKVYRKTIILLTEARLKLQKKKRKYLNFEYTDINLVDKKEIIKYLKENNARYYVYLTIKDKKRCKNNMCKVDYIVKVIDAKKKKKISLKLKATINNNKFTEIDSGLLKSNTKRLVKFLKKI